MDSDGMFLNLVTDEPATGRKQKITGGRWKDRQKAKKQAQRKDGGDAQLKSARVTKPRPTSKMNNDRAKNIQLSQHHKPGTKPMKGRPEDKTKSGEDTFVSSLFTSNPEHVAHEQQEYVAQEASNAPLTDKTQFEGLGLNKQLCALLEGKMEMERPTRIQRAVLPRLIQDDEDLFIQAETGSGKTLAYVLPMLERLMKVEHLDRNSGLFGVVIAPTRELSTQIYSVLEKLVRCCHWLVPGIVIGGEKKKSEKQRIRKGINILVGTPGRLADHFENTESLDLSQVRWLIMDEGDMLMELGFEETINKILSQLESRSQLLISRHPQLPKRRINVLCSATMKNNVKQLGDKSLTKARTVTSNSIAGDDDQNEPNRPTVAPAQLEQSCVIVPAKLRLVTLASILMDVVRINKQGRIMVFFSCSDSVNFHFDAFTRGGVSLNKVKGDDDDDDDDKHTVSTAPLLAENVHIHKLYGSLNQAMRTATLAAFKKPHDGPSILFSTDLLSRGVDLPLITNVVEYDPPAEAEEHLHRVGRTARAGAAGSSIIFLLPGKEEAYENILKPLHPNGIQHESFQELLKKPFGNKSWEVDATTWHLNVERWLLQDESALEKARNAFKSHIRAYTTHISGERSIFDMKSLHLGHLAKSFALRETPGAGSRTAKPVKEKDPRKRQLSAARRHAASAAAADEFNIS